jgi:hypothetical protein
MKTTDFSSSITSTSLAENIQKQFGMRVNINKYNREQLEDIRNKLRTRVFQQESEAGVNDLLTNEAYQKDKAMLELLNTRIKEMLGEDIKKLRDKIDQLSEGKKGVRQVKHSRGAKGGDQTGDGKKNFDDVQVARMTAGGVPKKKAIAKATSDNFKEGKHPSDCDCKECSTMEGKGDGNLANNAKPYDKVTQGDVVAGRLGKDAKGGKKVKEGFPTVADAQKRAAQEKGTGNFDKKPNPQNPSGTIYTKKHTKADAEPDKKVKEDMDSKSKSDKSKLPSMSHIKKMCQDGKSVAEICKMHPNCNQSELKQMVADCKKKMVKESAFKHNVRFVNESIGFYLSEDEEGKAKTITAAGDIVNDFTSWMQRVGQYQTKAIIELSDEIRAEFGPSEAEAFKQSVGPALSAALETLTQQREAISNAVAQLATGTAPSEPMGAEPGMDTAAPGLDSTQPDAMNPAEPAAPVDDFAAADAAAGGPEAAGREMRESKFARKLAESHSIMSKLAS